MCLFGINNSGPFDGRIRPLSPLIKMFNKWKKKGIMWQDKCQIIFPQNRKIISHLGDNMAGHMGDNNPDLAAVKCNRNRVLC